MAEVTLQNVTKRYGQTTAVEDMSLRVEDGELLVLVGPSGCGKSTTLRLIAGLEDLDGGTIQIGPQVVNHVAPRHRNIAMVFQNYALYPHMNVYKNMAFGLRMRRVPRAQIDQRVRAAAAILGIEGLLHRKPAQLSGGERQRVAVGRAIVRDPAVFLFDEPLSNLDARLRVTMRTELVKLHQRLQTTSIHVTHDQTEAMMMGHRIVVMHQGRIQQVGRPLEVYDAPRNKFVAEFIGSPPMNFLEGELRVEQDRWTFRTESLALELPAERQERYRPWAGKRVTLGIRPEHMACGNGAAREGGWSSASGQVVVAQPLGAETILDAVCGAHELVVRVDSHQRFQRGDQLTLHFHATHAHLFDNDTGAAL
ncbi:MAG: sn-glycerol-3-phosphate ABC transporter ATP-binding protein UgpC [Pirellulaceae bacterium]|nr:sn-glycerol-3-phosphate ABC transporter ATP-binding protein UgpC [Pirellulaceae bacterium]